MKHLWAKSLCKSQVPALLAVSLWSLLCCACDPVKKQAVQELKVLGYEDFDQGSLVSALEEGRDQVVRLMLRAGVIEEVEYPVMEALVMNERIHLFNALPSSTRVTSAQWDQLLRQAVEQNLVKAAELILGLGYSTASIQISKGEYGVDWAITRGNYEMAELLLGLGAQVRDQKSLVRSIDQPLDFIKLLLRQGANPNVAYNEQEYLIHYVVREKSEALLALLLKYGVKLNREDMAGRSLPEMALARNEVALFQRLLEAGADPYDRNADGENYLFQVLRIGDHPSIIEQLIGKKVSYASRDVSGVNVLESALNQKRKQSVRVLLELSLIHI